MDKLRNYLKYYPSELETYLFEDVYKSFHNNHQLTDKEFFAIICWKRKASAIKIANKWNGGWNKDRLSIENITGKVYFEPDDKKKARVLKSVKGIGIAIASAILSVCYPEEFTILDYRALNSLWKQEKKKCEEEKLPKKVEMFKLEDYFNYVGICKKVWKNYCSSLREFDKSLWAMDWCEGEKGLFVEVVDTYRKILKGNLIPPQP